MGGEGRARQGRLGHNGPVETERGVSGVRILEAAEELHYRPNADGSYLLYSVGEDGRDDGGDPTPRDQNQRTARFYSGRDLVWPMPATPEEIKAAEVRKR